MSKLTLEEKSKNKKIASRHFEYSGFKLLPFDHRQCF